ncbi:MAG: TetR/AcrR family transcriptional regulator [Paracoccaceae bacterium]
MPTKPRLTRTDWIRAAFRALTKGGPQAIRAETIARTLNVSKGSFYWHFKDVADLRAAMIAHWQQLATQAVIRALDERDISARDRLKGLIQITASDRNAAYGGPLVEAAIRDWARYDAQIKAAVRGVDQQRLDYVRSLFCDYGLDNETAHLRARTLYGALIGLQQISYLDGVDVSTDLMQLLDQTLSG